MPKLTFWYNMDGLKEQRTKNRYALCSFLFDCQKSINAIIAWWKLTNSPSLRLKEKDHLVHIGSLALQPPWPQKFFVLVLSTLEWWDVKSTAKPDNHLEPGTSGLGVTA